MLTKEENEVADPSRAGNARGRNAAALLASDRICQ